MACGLGAVALMFIFIKESNLNPLNINMDKEVELINNKITITENEITEINNLNNIAIINNNLLINEINEIKNKIESTNKIIDTYKSNNNEINERLKKIENIETKKYNKPEKKYISGCNVRGNKIIFLLDSSKSMIHEDLIEIYRLENQPKINQKNTNKWKQSIEIYKWMISSTPSNSSIMMAHFNENLYVPNNINSRIWLPKSDVIENQKALNAVTSVIPENGTDLINAFNNLDKWSDADSIYLITDGLPTLIGGQYEAPLCYKNNLISPDCRLKLFNIFEANFNKNFPRTKLNIILMPMIGDPRAVMAFSKLATETRGCFLSPSRDWLM